MMEVLTKSRVGYVGFIVLFGFTAANTARGQVPSALSVTVKKGDGTGTPIRTHPQGQVRVERGELLDANGKRLADLDYQGTVASWSFSPDGRFLAVGIRYDSVNTSKPKDSGTIRGYLHLYDAATGKLLSDCTPGNIGPVTNVAFSKDSKTLLYRAGKYEEVGGK